MKESLGKIRWKLKYRILAAAVLLSIIVSAAQAYTANAMFNEDEAVHIGAAEIPDTTLLIGTHLIWLDSMTEPLYQAACQSAADSGQGNVYYKSELGDGSWFEISGAGSLSDITEEGAPVPGGEIEALFLTHHTRADGITYRLKDNEPVNIFEITSPYVLLDIQELSELRDRYRLNGGGDAGRLLEGFFGLDLKTGETERLEGAEKEETDAIIAVADSLDARRRYIVYESLAGRLETLLEDLGEEAPGQTELQEAAGSSKAEVEAARNACEARMLSEGETILAKAEYEIVTTLSEALESKDKEGGRAGILRYRSVRNIAEGKARLIPDELSLLNETLIPEGKAAFQETGKQSALGEYKLLLAEKLKRLALEEAEGFLDELAGEPLDESLLKWVTEQAAALAGNKNSKIKELYGEKELLLQEKKKALDQEQLEKVGEINLRLSDTDSAIQDAEQAAANEISMLEERKAALAGDESDEAQTENAAGGEDIGSFLSSLEALCEGNPKLCGDALKEIYEAMALASYLEDDSHYTALMEQTEDILANHIPLYGQATEAEELGALLGGKEGEEAAQALLEAAIDAGAGASPDTLSLLRAKAEELAESREGNVFQEAGSGAGAGYVPVDAAARYAGLRYIWNDNRKQAILASREGYYELEEVVMFHSAAYVSADYMKEQFGCDIVEIPGTGYCMLVSGDAKEDG